MVRVQVGQTCNRMAADMSILWEMHFSNSGGDNCYAFFQNKIAESNVPGPTKHFRWNFVQNGLWILDRMNFDSCFLAKSRLLYLVC